MCYSSKIYVNLVWTKEHTYGRYHFQEISTYVLKDLHMSQGFIKKILPRQ